MAAVLSLLAACASMGRPDGGPRDTTPPTFVSAGPVPGTVNFSGRRITIDFDENVQLEDAMTKVVVSPAQKTPPSVSANGRRVTVELRDTLLPNTTYTIDFADAIKDLNEGNVLDGFAIDFSTGSTLDSLRISGMVFDASNLEPAQGMIVGAYLDRGDTAITTTAFDRICKTNQLGQFTLRNLKPGSYRVYALEDLNRDYHWDRTENIAFLDSVIIPTATEITVTDTLKAADGVTDSIVTATATRYMPNDVILTWFNEDYRAQYLKGYSRPDNRRLFFELGAPTDSLPTFRMLNGTRAGQTIDRWAVSNISLQGDSLEYWITDTTLLSQDSMLIEAHYPRLDSLERIVWATDTLKMNLRGAGKKIDDNAKKKKKDADTDTIAAPTPLADFSMTTGSSVDLNMPLTFRAAVPIASVDTSAVRMEMMADTLWVPAPTPRLVRINARNPLEYKIDYPWQPGTKYRLSIDSAAITDIYGLPTGPITQEFSTHANEDYAALFFNISGLSPSSPAFVELLSSGDAPVAWAPVTNGVAELLYIKPGTYYARLIIDTNGNGRWDHGMLLDSLQPEEVYYYPRALNLKKNWDVEQSWNIYDTPLDLQKPEAIKKNKPKRRPGQLDPNARDDNGEDELYDEFGNPIDPDDPFSTAPYRNPFIDTHRGGGTLH